MSPSEKQDAIALLRRLIDIDSTTFREGDAGVFLAEYLQARGFLVESTPVPQPASGTHTGSRFNVYAAAQPEAPLVVFSTHIDTVPPWIPQAVRMPSGCMGGVPAMPKASSLP